MSSQKRILVTGGCGYIGSHTIIDLVQHGYEVFSIDNYARSNKWIIDRVSELCGQQIRNFDVNLCDLESTRRVFSELSPISGVIHFAAYKAVGESVGAPLSYYENNVIGLINVLKCVDEFKVPHLVFSSSCTVYGNPDSVPVTEDTQLKPPESPYGRTKVIGETILRDVIACKKLGNTAEGTNPLKVVSLRYFNPVGAHISGRLGELPLGRPENLLPFVTQTAIGIREEVVVFGEDYPTRDGTCIRDYIHVSDIATAHTLALKHIEEAAQKDPSSNIEFLNLGSGNGVSVREIIESFIRVTGVPLRYRMGPRRLGDAEAVFADNTRARNQLGWNPKYTLEDMVSSAWKWECELKAARESGNSSS